jgi:hypothetical protein
LSVVEFLARIAQSLRAAEVPFMLTGSLAAAYYGTPRATQDIDVVISPGRAELEQLVDLLTDDGLYVSSEAALDAFTHAGQFNVIDPTTGWKADLIIRKARDFSDTEFRRRHSAQLFGVEVGLTTLEDLIIAKLEWSELGDSELQRRDIQQLLEVNRASLDWEYLEGWVTELGLETALKRIRDEAG